jgi:hypothetical protein
MMMPLSSTKKHSTFAYQGPSIQLFEQPCGLFLRSVRKKGLGGVIHLTLVMQFTGHPDEDAGRAWGSWRDTT